MKKLKFLQVVFAVTFLLVIVGCEDNPSAPKDSSPKSSLKKPVNIIVIVDISDRVSKAENPRQIEKDIKITKGIVNVFEEEFVGILYIGSKYTLAFVVPEQPNAAPIPQQTLENLKIGQIGQTSKKAVRIRASEFKKMKTTLIGAITELYQFVGKQNQFPGSDIWSWFRDSAEVYLKPDARNYIICLSDGYLDFNANIQAARRKRGNKTNYIPYSQVKKFRDIPNWKQKFHAEAHGLLEIGKDFSNYNVKFLMVEITERHTDDVDIVKEYWQTWLKSMGIADSQFLHTQDDPQIVIEKIAEFISTQ